MLESDPAKWIVVGILACIQFTYWTWQKSGASFELANLKTGLFTMLLTGCCCAMAPVLAAQSILAPLLAVLCGFLISGRQSSVNSRVGYTLGGMLAAVGFITATNVFVSLPEYTGPQTRWNESHYELTTRGLPNLALGSPNKHVPPGYADAIRSANTKPENPGPFHLIVPRPLWHSLLTGVYGRDSRAYRVWLPGGTAEEAIKGALAVPVGTPAGEERRAGIPIESYSDEDGILSNR